LQARKKLQEELSKEQAVSQQLGAAARRKSTAVAMPPAASEALERVANAAGVESSQTQRLIEAQVRPSMAQ